MSSSMTQMELSGFNLDIAAFEAVDQMQYPIEADVKAHYHQLGKRILKQLAEDLKLPKGSYEITSNKGGIAVWGEISLHAEQIYVLLCEQTANSYVVGSYYAGNRVMYRYCRGRGDTTGGRNRWCRLSDLKDHHTLGEMHKIAFAADTSSYEHERLSPF